MQPRAIDRNFCVARLTLDDSVTLWFDPVDTGAGYA